MTRARVRRSHRLLALVAAASSLALACESPQRATERSTTPAAGQVLLPVAEGTWQVFYLTDAWVAKHLGGDRVRRAWVRLAPAHPEDVADVNGMCPAPQRIVLGALQRDDEIRERTFACLQVCGPGEPDGSLYRGLWASGTHLEGLTAQLLDDGTIALQEHYRELAFTPPDVAEDPNVVDKLRYGSGVKTLSRTIAPSEFSFSSGEDVSCVTLEEKL